MKRSEMIQDLASDLIVELGDDVDIDYKKAQNIANTLLCTMENNGMLPPKRDLSENGWVLFNYEWEDEDE